MEGINEVDFAKGGHKLLALIKTPLLCVFAAHHKDLVVEDTGCEIETLDPQFHPKLFEALVILSQFANLVTFAAILTDEVVALLGAVINRLHLPRPPAAGLGGVVPIKSR